jgi:hypothetical protein
LIAGPFCKSVLITITAKAYSHRTDYVVQPYRFEVIEGFGCISVYEADGLSILLIDGWLFLFPLTSALFYCRTSIPYPTVTLSVETFTNVISAKVIRAFYMNGRETQNMISSQSSSLSRGFYIRVLALGCLDILWTLPLGIFKVTLDVLAGLETSGQFSFTLPWHVLHTDTAPFGVSYKDFVSQGPAAIVVELYFIYWAPVCAGFVIFALFGLTEASRASYARIVATCLQFFGVRSLGRQVDTPLSDITFSEHVLPSPGVPRR